VLPFLLAACTTGPERGPAVAVSAARETDGIRVQFRRLATGAGEHRARLAADGGRLAEVVHSPDLRTVSVLWHQPRGTLRCSFPYGGVGRFGAGDPTDPGQVDYVFHESAHARVTARVPRGSPMRSRLALDVHVGADLLPARLETPRGGAFEITVGEARVPLELPRDRHGVLESGDHEVFLHTAGGETLSFLVGIDRDGTPAATTGFVRNW
jgi:hypothetical protein